MGSRLELQSKLEDLLGNRNVYYQPPKNIDMHYPCIKYSKESIESRSANDAKYIINKRYQLIVISKQPDHPVIDKLLELPMSQYSRGYVSDGLHHDVVTLYY